MLIVSLEDKVGEAEEVVGHVVNKKEGQGRFDHHGSRCSGIARSSPRSQRASPC